MLISKAIAEGIADGSVTVAFRRWDRPRVRPGGTQRTVAGVVRFDSVEEIDPATLTEDDAARAGARSLEQLLRLLSRRDGAHVYRMEVCLAGADPRVALREQAELSEEDRRAVDERLDRWDAARGAPWTREILRLIADRPGVRAPDLAASLGRETLPFKLDVRKLKELGLTHSLLVGYELSPRGRAYLR
ncbi:hypothetical protein [Blastococcus sp. CT_GayMR16]|uniref:hypothetical protein n=1 Tax=Blastococcus sp. CT_GayMR16 TaxID=2559607 RepID=UPI001073A19B|nr:hypothetical protein [Blastococcus sp. CT_GayMR16]TFV86614.1 hypothetical protein E4P38_16530 [Blastococcus sp. CT_GayMR16]